MRGELSRERMVSAIIRQCRRFLMERESGESTAYGWLRECCPFTTVVRHYSKRGFTVFQTASILAYSDVHPLGEEALQALRISIEAAEAESSDPKENRHELVRHCDR